jgi:DNA (cytosine-5)-methyltransferase 3A
MSCGQIALRELGVKYRKYYASEIDRHCIRQTQWNFPETVQLGDIEGWRNWDIDWASISLILAGTPCTGFSFAGKGLAFDDPQSRLFFVFVDILNHIKSVNSDVLFLLENVKMKKWCLHVISEMVSVYPVFINSALVSAQNRARYYWSNIRTKRIGLFEELHTDIPQPEDRGITLQDILEDEVDKKYCLSGTRLARILAAEPLINPIKSTCMMQKNFTPGTGRNRSMIIVSTGDTPRYNQHKLTNIGCSNGHGASNHSCMDVIQLNPSRESGGVQPYQQNRVYHDSGKSPAHMANMSYGSYMVARREKYRRLTPTECARLQTIPAWYKWECSETQQYKMLGNGWTIEVIKHILAHHFMTSGS